VTSHSADGSGSSWSGHSTCRPHPVEGSQECENINTTAIYCRICRTKNLIWFQLKHEYIFHTRWH